MRQGRQGLLRMLALVCACSAVLAAAAFGQEHESDPPDEAGDDPIANRGDRYVPEPPGTIKKMRFWYGPYVMPAGWDANRVDLDLPVHNGMILKVEPELRIGPDWTEPSHQVAHIHHAHWFALDPGNTEDNYTAGNTEWIFGNGDEETRADFTLRSKAQPKGPFYGEYIGLAGPQAMIYMLHNKTAQTMVGYVALDVTFKYGTMEQLNEERPHHDISGVLWGRTFNVPRQRRKDGNKDGEWNTTEDMRNEDGSPRPIIWTSAIEGTMIGTGSHLHPGGDRVYTENLGSEENPCADDGRGFGGTLMLKADTINRHTPLSEDYQTEVTRPSWRAPIHVGDRIQITGIYKNAKHAWYTAMTHNGAYIDEAQPPKGRCKPYLVGKDRKKRVRRKVKGRAGRVRIVKRRIDPTEGVPNRKWGHDHDTFCGEKFGFDPCEPPFEAPPDGAAASRVTIANFQYYPGGRGAPGDMGLPPTVKQGTSLTFFNADQQANIRHSVTTCKYPCNGRYVSNYPWADGRWDSGTLGYDAIDGGTPDPVSATPKDLPVGKYSYFCRIHPFMRGEFRVVR
jgi:plastocyanin